MLNFATCADFVLSEKIEGGLVDDPRDPGGRTNRGITQKTLGQCRKDWPHLGLPEKVDDLSVPQARTVYLIAYWTPIEGDRLPGPVALMTFDSAVNQGVERAIKLLQKAVKVAPDGILGPVTFQAIKQTPIKELLAEQAAQRARAYALLDSIDDFYALGWFRRLFACYNLALENLNGSDRR